MLTGAAGRIFPHPPAYQARTGWGPRLAAVATLAIFSGAAALGYGVLVLTEAERADQHSLLWIEIVVQAAIIALTIFAAGMFGGRPAEVLALRRPEGGWRDVGAGIATIAVASGLYTLVTLLLFPGAVLDDLRPLWRMMQSEWAWVLALIAVIGAPISEEFLFRGFLQSALAKSRIGFANASIITTAAWTALHASYSIVGLGEVFLIGLVLSWLLWQTGSLWVPVLCHGVHNGAVILFLATFPAPG